MIYHCKLFPRVTVLLFMHGHYFDLFRHAKSMLMGENPIIDAFWGLYAGRHLGRNQGRKMKVGGITNIHPRQLFMNIKEQLWKVAGSPRFYSLSLSTGTHCN